MLITLLIWLIIWVLSVPLGMAVIVLLRRCAGMTVRKVAGAWPAKKGSVTSAAVNGQSFVAFSVAGLMVLTVYAEIFSVFHGVSALALGGAVLLAALAAIYLIYQQRVGRLPALCQEQNPADKCMEKAQTEKVGRSHAAGLSYFSVRGILLLTAAVLICAYLTSRGYLHYDSDLYHAQSIRWIETYGSVPGLANLHNRLGYNSAAFPLTALFSFAFVNGQSYHVVQGYLYLLLVLECSRLFGAGHLLDWHGWKKESSRGNKKGLTREERTRKEWNHQPVGKRRKGKIFPSGSWAADYLRLAACLYLFTVADEIVSPATDYFMVLSAFWLLIRWLDIPTVGEGGDAFRRALLSMLAVWIVTVKLSGAMLLLLAVWPVFVLLRQRKYRAFLCFVLTALVIVAPYLLRNIILSGYLVYPYPKVDLFRVDWKVPAASALADQREIMVWGRGYSDVTQYQLPFGAWFGGWFRQQKRLDQVLFCVAIVSTIPVVAELLLGLGKKIERRPASSVVSAEIVLILSVLFWLHSGPLMRYGCVFVYSLAFLNGGLLAEALWLFSGRTGQVIRLLVILWLCYKVAMTGREEFVWLRQPYGIFQQDYGRYAAASYSLDGVTFYYPTEGNQCGYALFPSAPTRRDKEIVLRGETLASGFRPVEKR